MNIDLVVVRTSLLFKFEHYGYSLFVFNDLGMTLCEVLGVLIDTVVAGGYVDEC